MVHPVIDLDIPETVGGLMNIQTLRRMEAVMQAQRAPFYQGTLDFVDVNTITQPEQWCQLPIMDRAKLDALDTEAFARDFCLATREETVAYWQAEGSPRFYPRTQRDMQYALVGCKRALTLAGIGQTDVAQMAMAQALDHIGPLMMGGGGDIGIGMISAGGEDASSERAQLDLITGLHPSVWIGSASQGLALGEHAKAEGADLSDSSVTRLLCSGEPLPDSLRRELAVLWGAEVRDCFGLSEVMMLGCEDAECFGFRFWSDYCYAEVLDPDTLEPVIEGQPGLLVVTPLVTNNATPFLRWNTGEMVTLRSRRGGQGPFDVFPLIQFQPKP